MTSYKIRRASFGTKDAMTHLQSSHERKGQAKVQFVRFEAAPVKLKLDLLTLIFSPRGNQGSNHELKLSIRSCFFGRRADRDRDCPMFSDTV